MTAGLRQYLMLAGVGVAGGFALIVAILGPGELMKRATSVVSPDNAPRTLADKPGQAPRPPHERPAAEKPAPEGGKQAALPPADSTQKRAAPVTEDAPSLDIVRVEPNGDAVIAGRTAPKAEVEILRDNKPIARAKADETGQFAIIPPTLPTGNSEISYRSVAPDGKETKGKESVAIVVAENRATKPLVAVSTPDKPTVVLSQPETPAAVSPETKTAEAKKALSGKAEEKQKEKPQRLTALPEPKAAAPGKDKSAPVKVVSIDAQEGGRLDVSGVAKPGATLRLYLNDTLVASGKAGADGKLAFTIGRGVRPGGYQVRIDQVEPETGKVENRAQVAFAFPEIAAAKVAAREPPPAATAPPPLPAKPDADRKPVGNLAERAPSTRDGNAASGASPPPAPAVEARASNRQAEAAKPPAPKPDLQPEKPESPVAAATPKPETQPTPGPDRPVAQARPHASEKPSEKAATPETKEPPSVAAAAPQPEAPAPGADKRMAERSAPKPSAAAPQTEPASPAPKPTEPTEGMKGDVPSPGATASVTPEPTPSDKPGTVFVPEISTAKITRGDNLWQISRKTYGNGLRYTVIFDANKDQIRDPDLIYPGQIFVLPKDEVGAKRG